jgi:hypothetical protein
MLNEDNLSILPPVFSVAIITHPLRPLECRRDSACTWHRCWGVELIPASAPDFFIEDTPTAVLVRQVLGAIAQFEKASLVAKLRAARERKKAAGGRGSGRFTYAQRVPATVALAKELHGQRMSLREISAALAAQGHVTGGGKPYTASAVQTMLHRK